MRTFLLLGSFVALVAALWAMWNGRFERIPGAPVWHLADLRSAPQLPGVEWAGTPAHPVLRVRVDAANPRVAARLVLPGAVPVEFLHVRFRMSSRGLTPGTETWEDGRLMVEWHPADGGAGWENDPIGSIRFDNHTEGNDLVIHPLRGPAVPALRLEHLGRVGEFEISDMEIKVIEERKSWKIGRWFLAASWLAWGFLFVRSWPGICRWRALCVSTIWLLMAIEFVVPGPWKILHPLAGSFRMGPEAELAAMAERPSRLVPGEAPATLSSAPIPALGKIPYQGSFAMRVKLEISKARPLLHLLLLFAPALAFTFLVGRTPAAFLVILLALAIEAAETAFGYGFDGNDILDLIWDAGGITLGIWACGFLRKRWPGYRTG